MNQSKLTDLTVENILFTGISVKIRITDLTCENLTNSYLESSSSQFYKILDVNYIFSKLLNLFLISNEKEIQFNQGSISLKEHILITTLTLHAWFSVYISVTF